MPGSSMARIAIALVLLVRLVSGATSSSLVEVGLLPAQDLAPLLRIEYKTDIFSKAQDYLESLRAKPVCHQVAAVDLIKTCEALTTKGEATSTEVEQSRDAAKTEYTVRLALCEMNDAQARIPKDCLRFLPSSKACSSSTDWSFRRRQSQQTDRLCYRSSNDKQINMCLATLYAGPQSWTSYSNAQQNAILVCQATLEAREKDRLLDMLTSAVEVNGQLSAANEESIRRQQAAQHAFDDALARFNTAAEAQAQEMEIHGGSIVTKLFEATQSTLSSVYHGTEEAVKSMRGLAEELSAGHATAQQLKETIASLHQGTTEARDELAVVHDARLQSTQASFDQIMHVIRQTVSQELAMIASRMENITDGATHATLALTSFGESLNRSQEMLEQHNVHASEVYAKIQLLMTPLTLNNIASFAAALLSLAVVHHLLRLTLGNISATLFACVFAAVSATHIYGPDHVLSRVGLHSAMSRTAEAVSAHGQTFALFGVFFILTVAASMLLISGGIEWYHAYRSRQPSFSLPITSTKLYNPESPPYHTHKSRVMAARREIF